MLSFMGESRRMTNCRINRELGVRLKYPEVSAALSAMTEEAA